MGLTSQAKADKHQRWWHLSSIQLAGGIISIPVIAIGSQIFLSSGLLGTVLSILIGNLINLVISYIFISMSFKKRLNAVENATQFLGKIGGKALAFFILTTTIGWVAWELFAGVNLLKIHPFFSKISIGTIIGTIASLILLYGIRGLKILCELTIFPLIVLLVLVVYISGPSDDNIPFLQKGKLFSLAGISLVLSSSIAAIVDYPTFFRHSKTRKDWLIALVVIFVVTSLVQFLGVFLWRLFASDNQLISHLIFSNGVHAVIIFSFLIISMIASLSWNVYAASVGWESLFPVFKDRTEYAVIGLLATLLFTFVPLENLFILVAKLSDTVICGMGGAIIFDFINKRKSEFFGNFKFRRFLSINLSWIIAALIGIMTYFHFFFAKDNSVLISLIAGFIIQAVNSKVCSICSSR